MLTPMTLEPFVDLPENRSAFLAIEDVAEGIISRQPTTDHNPLLLHGPTGTGKSHLLAILMKELTTHRPDLLITQLSARDLALFSESGEEGSSARDLLQEARDCDLLLLEDLQHLPPRAVLYLEGIIDHLLARGQQMIFTSGTSPRNLQHRQGRFPTRLLSRLVSGMVVHLEPLSAPSRLIILRHYAQGSNLEDNILQWLANHLQGGVRQLLGALKQLDLLKQIQGRDLDLETAIKQFEPQVDASKITMEHIADRVGDYFQVEVENLQSPQRYHHLLIPRQVSMYLARKLTGLSLEKIGAYFGGRDHTTVLHACRKVEGALSRDVAVSNAVRDLEAILK